MKDFLNAGFIILTLTCHLVTGEESTEASPSTGRLNLTSAQPVDVDNSNSNSSADSSESVSVTESSTNGNTTHIDPGESNSISPVNNEARTGNGGNGSIINPSTSSPSTTPVNVPLTSAPAIITTSPATTTTITTSTVSSSQPTTSTTVTTTESASSSSPETLPSSTETPTVTTRIDTSEDISTTYSTTENAASTVTPVSNKNSTLSSEDTSKQPGVTVANTQMSADIKSSSSSQTQPEPTTTLSPVEPSAESTTSGVSENTPDQKSSETEPVTENRTLSTESPGELPESANATTAERIAETTQRPKTTSPSESSEGPTTSISQSGCISTSELNTILVVAVIVGVNILSVVVTAFCVHRLVSKKLSWDPPPMHYSKRRSAGNHPVPAPRGTTTGRHLATDVECRAGETPATQIPIVITNEDGWCVPYSDQDKKKKNSVDNNTEDTGV